MGKLGVFSAVGELGLTLTYAVKPGFQIELGTGVGFSGLQLSAMPKVSLFLTRNDRLIVGVGPSVGLGGTTTTGERCDSYWLNADVGYEHCSDGGRVFLLAFGFGAGLGGKIPGIELADISGPPLSVAGRYFPQARIAFGRWF